MKIFLFLMCCSIFNPLSAQDTIHGFYYPNEAAFRLKKLYPHINKDEYDEYNAAEFWEGTAVVEYMGYRYPDSTSTGGIPAGVPSKIEGFYHKMGVMDTTGKVIVPIKYDKLYILKRNLYYEFTDGDSIGVVNHSGVELFRLSKNLEMLELYYKTRHEYLDYRQQNIAQKYAASFKTWIKTTENLDLIWVHSGTRDGIFSVVHNRFIIPIDSSVHFNQELQNWSLQPLELNDHYLLCKDSNYLKILDLNTLKLSGTFEKAWILPEGKFYFQEGSQKILSENILTRKSIVDDPILEFEPYRVNYWVYNEQRNVYDEERKTVYQFIFQQNDKLGVFGLNQEVIIPPVYDDIYMVEGVFFWVRKDNKWAILNSKNEQLTPFEFKDVDHINDQNFSSFLYLFNEDTTQLELINEYGSRELERYDKVVRYIWEYPSKKDRKIIFSHQWHWARKEDGCHLINYDFTDGTLEVIEDAWDGIYTIPSAVYSSLFHADSRGVRKDGKYGYLGETEICYNGIVLDPLKQHSSGYVKGKHIYYMVSNGWDKNRKWTRYYKYVNRFPDKIEPRIK